MFVFVIKCTEGFRGENSYSAEKPSWLLFSAVKWIRKQVVSAVRAAHRSRAARRSRAVEELPWSVGEGSPQTWLLHTKGLSSLDAHVRWAINQGLLERCGPDPSPQAISLWQYGDWPLSSAAWAEPPASQASWSTSFKRARGPLLRVWTQTHLQGSSCSHFITSLLEESSPPRPVKWTPLFNPDLCLRNATWNTVANLLRDLGTFHLNSRLRCWLLLHSALPHLLKLSLVLRSAWWLY